MSSHRPAARAFAAAALIALAACGGGGSGGNPSPSTGADPGTVQLTAAGTSASTVSLAWTPTAAASQIALERREGNGPYVRVATVGSATGAFIDDGLAPSTAYGYRLVSDMPGGAPLASASATTSDETPVSTAAGMPIGLAASAVLTAQATHVASPDGAITLDLPAGAVAAGTELSTQAVANTAPDGLGNGLRVRLSAVPSQPATLRVRYDEADAEQADGLRIAVQRSDGSWLSLPLTDIDKTTRTLSASLPLSLLASPPHLVPASATRPHAPGDVSLDFAVVKYIGVRLSPRRATVRVEGTQQLVPQARVRGYDVMAGTCSNENRESCVLSPVMEMRDVPLLNQKTGYTRSWSVFLLPGGDAIHGTVTRNAGNVGAVYTAPRVVPDPRTVTVTFESTHLATGRSVLLSSAITVSDGQWAGTLDAVDGPSSEGTTLLVHADVSWTPDLDASTDTLHVYRAQGTVGVTITDDNCTVQVTPTVVPVTTDPNFARLEIDTSTTPHRYKLRLVTFWNATLTGSCSNEGTTTVSGLTGWGWEGEGVVEGVAGNTIRFQPPQGGQSSWSFSAD